MRIRLWLGGWLWLFLLPTLIRAQPARVTEDDVVIDLLVAPDVNTIQLASATFDSLVGKKPDAVQRSQLAQQMQQRLQKIQDVCALTDEQVAKLQLAIRTDAQRLVRDYTTLRARYVDTKISRAEYTEAFTEIHKKLAIPLADPCGEHSLFLKILQGQLTEEQAQKFAELDQKERLAELRSQFDRFFTGNMALTAEQGEAIAALCLKKYPRYRRLPLGSTYTMYAVMLMAAELKDDIRPHLTVAQRVQFDLRMQNARQLEPTIRRVGLWPPPSE